MSFSQTAGVVARSTVKRESLYLDGPTGRLEAVFEYPDTIPPRAKAVVCHPHPRHGGTLNNKVVYTLARAAALENAAVLRFNFRGVGRSAGRYDEGRGEIQDLAAAEAWLDGKFPALPCWRLGFSFGAAIAIAASVTAGCERLVTVAPPVDSFRDYGLEGVAPRAQRWLLVQGDADEVVAPRTTLDWARSLNPAPEIAIFEGVGHYFHGQLTALRERVIETLSATDGEQD